MTLTAAFDSFISQAESAILSSTKASWSGSSYSVELFQSGDFRVLWSNDIGNLYNSEGVILPIPPLGDEEYCEDEEESFFGNAIAEMKNLFQEILEEIS